MKLILLTFLFLFITNPGYAQVFKWVDDKGSVHFTDDISKIPEKYRQAIEEIEAREEKSETKTESGPPEKSQADNDTDRLGRGKEYWQGRVEEWKKKLRSAQERVESLRLKYNQLTEKFNASKSSVQRATLRNERDQIKAQIDQSRMEIEEAKEVLDRKIPEEAALYKAKPEWIKP